MILQVKNTAQYVQSITLHTGEAKSIDPDTAIKINTGSDKRLASYYASLISYNFAVSLEEGDGNDHDIFNDALNKIKGNIDKFNKQKVYNGDTSVYPKTPAEMLNDQKKVEDKKVVDVEPVAQSEDDNLIMDSHGNGSIYQDKQTVIMDSKGVVDEQAQVAYTEEPTEKVEEKVAPTPEESVDESNSEWSEEDQHLYDVNANKLDVAFDEDELKQIINKEFNESPRTKKKSTLIWKILSRVDYKSNEFAVDELIKKHQFEL